MADNRFKIKNGLLVEAGPTEITGSLIAPSITGSLLGTASWAINSLTASYIDAGGVSGLNLSRIASGSATASISPGLFNVNTNTNVEGNLTASNALFSGTITAQTLVVQTVTSSVVYSSGSNIFGNQLTDVQAFTGSLRVTGSGDHYIAGGNVGIDTTNPQAKLHLFGGNFIRTNTDYLAGSVGSGFLIVPGASSGDTYTQIYAFQSGNTAYANLVIPGGNVGVSTTAPNAKLDVNGNAIVTGSLNVTSTITGSADMLINGITIGRGKGNVATNVVMGNEALFLNTTGDVNVAIGNYAGYANIIGYGGVFVGWGAGNTNNANNNVAIGYRALFSNDTGTDNISIGSDSLYNSTGAENIAIGSGAGTVGTANTTGGNNIFIGYRTAGVSATESNRTWIGNSSTTSTWLGGNLLLGRTFNDGRRLQVNGSAIITGSLIVTEGITGSLFGTASFATSASFALTSSFLSGEVVSASYAKSASYAIINESQYRFENQTTLDQDIWLSNEVITKIVKSAGVNTAEYRTGSAAYNSITFTGDTFTGTIPVSASDVFSWRITYNSGYTSAALIVLHSKV